MMIMDKRELKMEDHLEEVVLEDYSKCLLGVEKNLPDLSKENQN